MSITFKELVAQKIERSDLGDLPLDQMQHSELDLSEAAKTMPKLSDAMQDAMKRAKTALEQHPIVKKLADDAADMPAEDVIDRIQEITKTPEFLAVAELARKDGEWDDRPEDWGGAHPNYYKPRTVYFEVIVTGLIGLGVGAGVGLYIGGACCLDEMSLFSVFVGGTVGYAQGALAAGGIGIGVTPTDYAEMTGFSAGIDAGLANGIGLYFDGGVSLVPQIFPPFLKWSPGGWYAGGFALAGYGGGVEGYIGFTLSLFKAMPAAAMPEDANYSFYIKQIKCFHKWDGNVHDELYLYLDVDNLRYRYRYPFWDSFAIKQENNDNDDPDAVWDIGWTISFKDKMTLSLIDYNGPFSDTLLCSFELDAESIAEKALAGQPFDLSYDSDVDAPSRSNHVAYTCYCERTK